MSRKHVNWRQVQFTCDFQICPKLSRPLAKNKFDFLTTIRRRRIGRSMRWSPPPPPLSFPRSPKKDLWQNCRWKVFAPKNTRARAPARSNALVPLSIHPSRQPPKQTPHACMPVIQKIRWGGREREREREESLPRRSLIVSPVQPDHPLLPPPLFLPGNLLTNAYATL